MLTKSKKTKMGRPMLPKGTANSVLFAVRIAQNEAERIEAAIKQSGMKRPEWARNALINAAS
jgi:hypothetical protein